MTDRFAQKYNAVRFDPTDPNEALAEKARRAVLAAYMASSNDQDDLASRQLEYLLGGLLVGVAQVMQSSGTAATQDEVDAAIRSSIIQSAGWAVDTARAMMGLDPLSEGN